MIIAPFTPEQVEKLNKFQHIGWFHPFTCGKRDEHPYNEGVLIATTGGWICPAPECDYTQAWAHDFMAEAPLKRWQRELTEVLNRESDGSV